MGICQLDFVPARPGLIHSVISLHRGRPAHTCLATSFNCSGRWINFGFAISIIAFDPSASIHKIHFKTSERGNNFDHRPALRAVRVLVQKKIHTRTRHLSSGLNKSDQNTRTCTVVFIFIFSFHKNLFLHEHRLKSQSRPSMI